MLFASCQHQQHHGSPRHSCTVIMSQTPSSLLQHNLHSSCAREFTIQSSKHTDYPAWQTTLRSARAELISSTLQLGLTQLTIVRLLISDRGYLVHRSYTLPRLAVRAYTQGSGRWNILRRSSSSANWQLLGTTRKGSFGPSLQVILLRIQQEEKQV